MSSVDVIVPCYRYGHFLRGCVESILVQSGTNVRVLIIDDASPDNTAEVAAALTKADSRVTFLRHITNKGHIATYNEGIEWASADYMLILSADDYLLPDALSRSANLMDAYPNVGFTFGKTIRSDDRGMTGQSNIVIDKADWHILSGLEFIEISGACNIVHTATAVVRTELQKRLGGYRAELPHSGDMEMWLRFAAHASVGIFEEYQAVYRSHGSNMTIGYLKKSGLPDLQQIKAAFDCFFQYCSDTLPNAQQLHRRLFWLLGCQAIGFASAAYNDGEIDDSEQLSKFALSVCPQIKRSLPWTKLTCKRYLGLKGWNALQPAVAVIRQVTLPLKRLVMLVSSFGVWSSKAHGSGSTLSARIVRGGDRCNAGPLNIQEK